MTDENITSGAVRRKPVGRGARYAWGANVFMALCLAGALLAMVNYASYRYADTRWDLSSRGDYRLSPKTLNLIDSLRGDVSITAFFQSTHPFHADVRSLLKQYEYAAGKVPSLRLTVSFVDPDRDLVRARELVRQYDVTEANVVVVESGGRKKFVTAKDIVQSDVRLEGRTAVQTPSAFRGEQAFSSAILNVTQAASPIVYFLVGHGERDPENFNKFGGYSQMAVTMMRDNIEVKRLVLASSQGVPRDASALVVAGPDRPVPQAELDAIGAYLNRKGRLLLLTDAGTESGFEKLMEPWGVRIGREVVIGLTLTGRDLVVAEYGDHAITRNLHQVTTILYRPRVVEPVNGAAAGGTPSPDRPKVTVLSSNTREGWMETDLSQVPPKFDANVDRPGVAPVAVAVEKGAGGGIDVELKPTRIVVVGDSDFISNGALTTGGSGNVDFFMSALNWLLERDQLMAISPRAPGLIRLDMDEKQIRLAFAIFSLGLPSVAALLGLTVWMRRRR